MTYHRYYERSFMPNIFLNLQLFGEEGSMADTGDLASPVAENPVGDGVATINEGEQIAPAEEIESWDSIKSKYKKEIGAEVKAGIDKRFKNQRNLQAQIDSIDPMIKALAERYGVQADATGAIPIEALTAKVMDDNSMYEQEAFQRGMSVEDLKQIKSLERENAQLRMQSQRSAEAQEWDAIVQEGNAVREIYPDFDLDTEMMNPNFGRLLATLKKSGFNNALQTAYESVHRDEIMGGAMRYAVQQTQQKISNSIQSGMNRPVENGTMGNSAGAPTALDPSKLTKAQIEEMKMRALRGERITF